MTTSSTQRPAAARPVPVPDQVSADFWDAAAAGRLALQRCDGCGHLAYPPRLICPACQVDPPSFAYADVSGHGQLATWTIVRDAFLPGFTDDVPFVLGEVELTEQAGLRIVARVVGVDHAALRIGLPLAVDFVDGGEGTRVPVFTVVTP